MDTTPQLPPQRPSNTKIVATVGPSSDTQETLESLIAAGVDVFRVNTAHGDQAQWETRLGQIRAASKHVGQLVAILVDLAGPKIRLGELPKGHVRFSVGQQVRFVRGTESEKPEELVSNYDRLVDELSAGDRVMLADGTVSLVVEDAEPNHALCRVVQPGLVRSRQGINLPGAKLTIPTLGDDDRQHAAWAARNEVDFLGLSFVRKAQEIRELRSLLQSHGSEAQIIAKIEKPEALSNFEEIAAAADAVMVARGDLGVETDIAEIAVAQKQIIEVCNNLRKPVIIATQMLDSMQHSSIPTRAEVTDVANAILDGADACMLSGETAIGAYPRQAVEMMHRIALATEPVYRKRPPLPKPDLDPESSNQITAATVYHAGRLAEEVDAKMVVVATASGHTALALSKNRSFVPTVGVSDSEATLRRMCLYWGVVPLTDAPTHHRSELLEYVVARGRERGYLVAGDRIVLITGTGLVSSAHNMVVVHELP